MAEDASTAASAYREVLGRFGTVVDFDISALDRLDVAVTSCSLVVDGVAVHHGNGYAASSEQAELSGLGELAEGVLSARAVRELDGRLERASRTQMITRYGSSAVVDPRLLALPAGSDYDDDQHSDWAPAQTVRDSQTVWVPVEFLASDPSEVAGSPLLITPVTNGLGAGLDRERALAHGIGEIAQRHTNGLRFRALDRLSPVIDPAGLPPGVRALCARFAEVGVGVVIKYVASSLGTFSCYAVGHDEQPGSAIMVSGCGEAADPSPERSMTKAVLEYANSRARKAFCFGDRTAAAAVAPEAYWSALPKDPIGEPRTVHAMQAWSALSEDELRTLTEPHTESRVIFDLTGESTDPASDRATDPATDPAGTLTALLTGMGDHRPLALTIKVGEVWVAKTLVPGLDVETLSYGRIGEEGVRTSLAADLDLVRVQPQPSERHHDRVALTRQAEERLGGPVWYSYQRADEIIGDLYPLYREPPRHSVEVTGRHRARTTEQG